MVEHEKSGRQSHLPFTNHRTKSLTELGPRMYKKIGKHHVLLFKHMADHKTLKAYHCLCGLGPRLHPIEHFVRRVHDRVAEY